LTAEKARRLDGHAHSGESGSHTHGWGFRHTHDLSLVTGQRPSLWLLLGLGVAGGLLPDPFALGLLLNLLAQGKVMLGLGTVVVFSLGFAAVLVIVGAVRSRRRSGRRSSTGSPASGRTASDRHVAAHCRGGRVLTVNAWRMLGNLASSSKHRHIPNQNAV
jgi:ABC-type nickel/cobalt efflux system permease component RcnA